MPRPKKPAATAPTTQVETLVHPADIGRKNIPTAENSALMEEEEARAKPKLYPRDPTRDPQLVWRGKEDLDSVALSVPTVPIYIQEKLYPEALIRDLQRASAEGVAPQADLFSGFDRIKDDAARVEFYQHAENWSNRMILGDSLLVMNSLAEKEGLRGQVQMIFLDPPYGIKFGSNWQPSTKAIKVDDGAQSSVTREPEQIKAFRDTWNDGVHSYLSFWRDRLVVARELLADTGSIFVQISDTNLHLVRSLLDEVFGSENYAGMISFSATTGQTSVRLAQITDYLLWYGKTRSRMTFHQLYKLEPPIDDPDERYVCVETPDGTIVDLSKAQKSGAAPLPAGRILKLQDPTSQSGNDSSREAFDAFGMSFRPSGSRGWSTSVKDGLPRMLRAGMLHRQGNGLWWKSYRDKGRLQALNALWTDTRMNAFGEKKVYVVQTAPKVLERCILMTTNPGDLVVDPTCGSGTTAVVAEEWGRRWITTDTSRVALALARTRLMAGRFPAYLLRDSREGAAKEGEITGRPPEEGPFRHDIRQGFVLERVPHVTLKSIANNTEIDVIHAKWAPRVDAALAALNAALGTAHSEWQVPRALPDGAPDAAAAAHAAFWQARRDRQAEMDASIARNADVEFLHDRPYTKKNAVRVTGPFTVESLSPHRVLPADEEDAAVMEALAQETGEPPPPRRPLRSKPDSADDFVTAVLDNLAKAGVQNTKKNERLSFATIRPWPGGRYVAAEAEYEEAGAKKRAAIVIGPEYGTVGTDLVREAAKECRDWADAMVVCGFAFDPQVGDSTMNLGRLVVMKARMSQELRAAEAYKSGGGNLFVVFGEPDIALDREGEEYVVRLKGVDIFDPTTGEVRCSKDVKEDVACWFVDTDYDNDSFFVRHAYFLGGKDPFEKLKAALKAEVDEDAWASLYRTESRPFGKPKSGRIAVKVINHYGDEAMRVFRL
jgi:adenine-specific DNA-methyltransferase